MAELSFDLPRGGVHTITDATVSALLGTGSGEAARLYLYLLTEKGRLSEPQAQRTLGLDASALRQALALLKKAGVLQAADVPARLENDARPDYSGAEVAGGMQRDPAFRHVADETQRRLGKVLSSSDLQILYGLYDWRGFSPGVISLLTAFCMEEARRRYGEGRPPTMRQIDREAAVWEAEGIDTEEKAEQHIHEKEGRRRAGAAVLRALGINSRTPSAGETRYINDWIGMGFPVEVIEHAYDKTVLKTGGLNWAYMNSILKSWHGKNLHTLPEIEQGDTAAPRAKAPKGAPSAPSSIGTREREAVERMRKYVEET